MAKEMEIRIERKDKPQTTIDPLLALKQANKVAENKIMEEIIHGVKCGCSSCKGIGEKYINLWFGRQASAYEKQTVFDISKDAMLKEKQSRQKKTP